MNNVVDTQLFRQLRARIESTFTQPAMILITSALRGDGKSVAAFGLAEALAEAEYRVLLIDANVRAPILPRPFVAPIGNGSRPPGPSLGRSAKAVSGQRFFGLALTGFEPETALSLGMVRSAAIDLRAQFDFVIVDAAALGKSDLALLFAVVSDGTLLTVRLGRLPAVADEATVKLLERVNANVLGVVTIDLKMIRTFSATVAQSLQAVVVPVRHVTTRHAQPDPSFGTVET